MQMKHMMNSFDAQKKNGKKGKNEEKWNKNELKIRTKSKERKEI